MAMSNTPKASGSGFKMKPGSKNVHSEGSFRMDSPLKALGFQGQGSPMMEKKKDSTKGPVRGTKTKRVGKYIKYRDSYGGRGRNTDLLKVGKKYAKKAYNKAKSTYKKYFG